MGNQYKKLKQKDIEFIKNQHMFFIASSSDKEVNLSPKGYDSIRVLDESRVLFLDYPGSGNRTARDIEADGEVTIMFCAFEGSANITKLFCKGELIEKSHVEFDSYLSNFDENKNIVRRVILLNIYAVETSCGNGVPYMTYSGNREKMHNWITKMDKNDKLNEYIQKQHIPPSLDDIDD
jgi:hypothetical protein